MTIPTDKKQKVQALLQSTYYLALSTQGTDGVWVNPVYYAYDDSLNL